MLFNLVSLPQSASAAEGLEDAIQKVMPAVVRVRAVRGRRLGFAPNGETSPRRFEVIPDGNFFGQGAGGGMAFAFGVAGQISEGAGIVWRKEGYILTTFSIVNRAERVEVTLNDGRTVEAKSVGVDPMTDLAVVKVEAELSAATLGDVNKTKVGEPVFAIGHPAGFVGTVVRGIISGLNRTLNVNGQNLHGLIQTDLAIAPGFSGGPLANGRGEIIGINIAQFRPPQSFSAPSPGGAGGNVFVPSLPNLSFALPINEVKRYADELIAHGKALRPYLGVQLVDVDEERQQQTKLPDRAGAFVTQVPPDGPAGKAGVRPEDVLRRVGGQEVSNAASAIEEVRRHKPGDKLELEIWRDGAMRNVEVTLGDMANAPRPTSPLGQGFPPFPPDGGRLRPNALPGIPPEASILSQRLRVRITSPRDNETVKGTVAIRVTLMERERFPWMGVWVDEQFVAMTRVSNEPFMLDTTKFPNGLRVVRVKAISLNNDAAPGATVRIRVQNGER
jgi:serine protease Do